MLIIRKIKIDIIKNKKTFWLWKKLLWLKFLAGSIKSGRIFPNKKNKAFISFILKKEKTINIKVPIKAWFLPFILVIVFSAINSTEIYIVHGRTL